MRKITGSDIVRPIAETKEWFVTTPAVALLKDGRVTSACEEKAADFDAVLAEIAQAEQKTAKRPDFWINNSHSQVPLRKEVVPMGI